MAVFSNVALTDTFQTWLTRTNQVIERFNNHSTSNTVLFSDTLTANSSLTLAGGGTLNLPAASVSGADVDFLANTNSAISGKFPTSGGSFTGAVTFTKPTTFSNTISATANVNIQSATFYVDAANNRVGINTTVPQNELQVSDTGGEAKIRLTGTTIVRFNYIGVTGTDNLVLSADENAEGADSSIRLRVDGGEKLRVLANGSVGIGNTAPSASKLTVNGTIKATPTATLLIANSSGATLKTINGIGSI